MLVLVLALSLLLLLRAVVVVAAVVIVIVVVEPLSLSGGTMTWALSRPGVPQRELPAHTRSPPSALPSPLVAVCTASLFLA